jgi:hypothetical protein
MVKGMAKKKKEDTMLGAVDWLRFLLYTGGSIGLAIITGSMVLLTRAKELDAAEGPAVRTVLWLLILANMLAQPLLAATAFLANPKKPPSQDTPVTVTVDQPDKQPIPVTEKPTAPA